MISDKTTTVQLLTSPDEQFWDIPKHLQLKVISVGISNQFFSLEDLPDYNINVDIGKISNLLSSPFIQRYLSIQIHTKKIALCINIFNFSSPKQLSIESRDRSQSTNQNIYVCIYQIDIFFKHIYFNFLFYFI